MGVRWAVGGGCGCGVGASAESDVYKSRARFGCGQFGVAQVGAGQVGVVQVAVVPVNAPRCQRTRVRFGGASAAARCCCFGFPSTALNTKTYRPSVDSCWVKPRRINIAQAKFTLDELGSLPKN